MPRSLRFQGLWKAVSFKTDRQRDCSHSRASFFYASSGCSSAHHADHFSASYASPGRSSGSGSWSQLSMISSWLPSLLVPSLFTAYKSVLSFTFPIFAQITPSDPSMSNSQIKPFQDCMSCFIPWELDNTMAILLRGLGYVHPLSFSPASLCYQLWHCAASSGDINGLGGMEKLRCQT